MAMVASYQCCVVALFLVAFNVAGSTPAFDGFELIAVTPMTNDDIAFLQHLQIEHETLDFWQHPMLNTTCYVLVHPGMLASFKDMMQEHSIPWSVASTNISPLVEATYPKPTRFGHRLGVQEDVHEKYHNYHEIVYILQELALKYSDLMELSHLNEPTSEGRQVIMAKLHGTTTGFEKPAIVVEAGIHAREWISPAANLYVIEQLLKGYSDVSSNARSMLDNYDWYFVPVTNPDGYTYTHTNTRNRLWRKNRRETSSGCFGVDLNRNFDIEHGTTGVSKSCSSDIYPGLLPFTETETRNIKDLVDSLADNLVAYVAVHSYSQLLLVPWSYTYNWYERPLNHRELYRVANLMTDAIMSTSGETYRVGTAYETLNYAASGGSFDWALHAHSGIYSYAYELRPEANNGLLGFLLPPEQIIATGEEYMASLHVMSEAMNL